MIFASMLRRFVFISVPLFGFLLLLEMGVRLFFPQTVRHYIRDPWLGARLLPDFAGQVVTEEFRNAFHTNSLGFHDVEHVREKPDGVFRILLLGDSFIEGLQVALPSLYPRMLEQILRDRLHGQKIEVIAMGISGFGTAQELEMLRHYGLAFQPDLVLLHFFVLNDFRNNHPRLEYEYRRPFYLWNESAAQLVKQDISLIADNRTAALIYKKSCQACLLLADRWEKLSKSFKPQGLGDPEVLLDYQVFNPDPDPLWLETKKITQALILEMQRLARTAHADFGMVILPNRAQVHPEILKIVLAANPGLKNHDLVWDLPQQELAVFCREQKLACLDMLPVMQKQAGEHHLRLFFQNDGHWNKQGHQTMAEEVAFWMIQTHGQP